MTATQAPPEVTTPDAPSSVAVPGGLAGVLGSADHKVVGRLYIGAALLLGLGSAATGLLGGIDRIDGTVGNTILDLETAPQVASFHVSSAILLFLLPALLGLAMVVVPLQVGARAIAFPRAAAASFWGFLVGAALTVTSYAINGGPGGGRSDGVDLWAAATGMVIVALLLGSVCVATTVLAVRTRGMSLDRVPMFAWSLLCTTVIWILTLPVLLAVLVIIYVDHRSGQVFLGGTGPSMSAQVSWITQQPQVYAAAIPVLGVVLDAVATAAGRPLQRRGLAQGAVAAFAALSVGAFALPAISPDVIDQPVSRAMSILVLFPLLAVVAVISTTFKGSRPKVTSGLVGGALGLVLLVIAALVGGQPAGADLTAGLIGRENGFGYLDAVGTQYQDAQAHLVLVAAVIALVTGLYHWSTKVLGRRANEAAGRTAPLVLAVGALVLAVPEALSGITGEDGEQFTGIEALNGVAVAGAGVVVLGALLAAVGLIGKRSEDEPADPWGGQTLEWATPTPPPFANFAGPVPEVTSAEPLLTTADAEEES